MKAKFKDEFEVVKQISHTSNGKSEVDYMLMLKNEIIEELSLPELERLSLFLSKYVQNEKK